MNQRNGNKNISITPELATTVPDNMAKRKERAKFLGDHTFTEPGQLEYGYEIGCMASADGYNRGPNQSGGRKGRLDAEFICHSHEVSDQEYCPGIDGK